MIFPKIEGEAKIKIISCQEIFFQQPGQEWPQNVEE